MGLKVWPSLNLSWLAESLHPAQHQTLLEATQERRTRCLEQSFTVFMLLELPNYSFHSSLDLLLGQRKVSPGTRH